MIREAMDVKDGCIYGGPCLAPFALKVYAIIFVYFTFF